MLGRVLRMHVTKGRTTRQQEESTRSSCRQQATLKPYTTGRCRSDQTKHNVPMTIFWPDVHDIHLTGLDEAASDSMLAPASAPELSCKRWLLLAWLAGSELVSGADSSAAAFVSRATRCAFIAWAMRCAKYSGERMPVLVEVGCAAAAVVEHLATSITTKPSSKKGSSASGTLLLVLDWLDDTYARNASSA